MTHVYNPEFVARTVREGVERWGAKNYGTGEFHLHDILTALCHIDRQLAQLPTVEDVDAMHDELKRLRKELALAKAREGKRIKAEERKGD